MAKRNTNNVKLNLHERNRNRERYDLEAMVSSTPELKHHIKPNKNNEPSIDFSSRAAVRILNKSILQHYYGIKYWEFPSDKLCPAIPGRAEYIHAMADMLSRSNQSKVPKGDRVTCLDIGMGASCIFPIIGVTEYEWNFIGSDIDMRSISSSKDIIKSNPSLSGKVECKHQPDARFIFKGIVSQEDKVDLVICNPPFHSSMKEALEGTHRKERNLTGKKSPKLNRNFSGGHSELVYRGGELKFISNMINESKQIRKNCMWFSSLVSKSYHVKKLQNRLNDAEAAESRLLNISTGNKVSRIIAWTFLSEEKKMQWRIERWQDQPS